MTITNLPPEFYAQYVIRGTIREVPDIEKSHTWKNDPAKIMRPSIILIEYYYDNGEWEQEPHITVYGRRIRKDGALGAEMQISFSYALDQAPQWVQTFVAENKPPGMTFS